jgi:hypothetical protein
MEVELAERLLQKFKADSGCLVVPVPASLNQKRELVIGITKHASLLADQADE